MGEHNRVSPADDAPDEPLISSDAAAAAEVRLNHPRTVCSGCEAACAPRTCAVVPEPCFVSVAPPPCSSQPPTHRRLRCSVVRACYCCYCCCCCARLARASSRAARGSPSTPASLTPHRSRPAPPRSRSTQLEAFLKRPDKIRERRRALRRGPALQTLLCGGASFEAESAERVYRRRAPPRPGRTP